MRATQPIGVFDSGLGGLTVVAALRRAMPAESVLYLGDTARLPYGTKSAATVLRYSLQVCDFLQERRVKYIVAACNTASALALPQLPALAVGIIGVVGPGAQAAANATRNGRIGVLGTLATVASGSYVAEISKYLPSAHVYGQACPLLVPLAEEGWQTHPVTRQVAEHYLLALREQCGEIDTLVLGCTHYPLLKGILSAAAADIFGRVVRLVDSANTVAAAVAAELRRQGLARAEASASPAAAKCTYFVTDESRFEEHARRFLGHSPGCQRVDLS